MVACIVAPIGMPLPVYLHIGSLRVHPHWVFETLAYAVAFRVYLWMRRAEGDVLDLANRWWDYRGSGDR